MDVDEFGQQTNQCRLEFMPSFRLHLADQEVPMTRGLAALVVSVVLEGERTSRRMLQARMWPDLSPSDGSKRLRQLLWRVGRATDNRLLEVTTENVSLSADVLVDLHHAEERARKIVDDEEMCTDPLEWRFLRFELLAGWADDRVVEMRARWDRLRMMTLEHLAEKFLEAGKFVDAIETANAASTVDSLSEASHRILATAYLRREDPASAWRVYVKYRALLLQEIGLEPSSNFRELFSDARVMHTAKQKPSKAAPGRTSIQSTQVTLM
ncbi:AfsR/SARP family transcriptional regulator [Spirillospora sp. CA-294931]|uniref:AfsR/SARP family transcriptional regulator n=1 Tax=Spirillospora sp. CA-294931 TaxID=3240042 RepID=UPI003D8AB5AB